VIGQQITLAWGSRSSSTSAAAGAARFQPRQWRKRRPTATRCSRDRNAHDQSEHVQGFLRHGARLRPSYAARLHPFILAVHPSDACEFGRRIDQARQSKPGALNYGSGGSGTPPHLATELFKTMPGVNLRARSLQDGRRSDHRSHAVAAASDGTVGPAGLPQIRAGRIRGLAYRPRSDRHSRPSFPPSPKRARGLRRVRLERAAGSCRNA